MTFCASCLKCIVWLAGKRSYQAHSAAHTIARAIPVVPEVASITESPGLSSPRSSASLMMA